MEGIMRIRSSLIVWVAALLATGAAPPAMAKKAPAPTCAAQFAIAQSGVANVPASVLRLVSIDSTGVTVSTDCGTVVSRPKRTRTGWKFRAHWRPCDGKAKVVLAAKVDRACTTLNGVLRTRKPKKRVKLGLRVAPPCGDRSSFSSTFSGIQSVIFEKHGCTNQACHGSTAKQGGLDLSPDVAYQNLLQVPSTASPLVRVEPGDERRSFLWLKLAAATDPSLLPAHVEVPGAPMPNGLPPLSKDELELVRLWIYNGAPETGTVAGTDKLLGACLPPPTPITIEPLAPPAPGDGIQFVMPPWHLEAHSEHEICFATYYDITSQVPKEFQDPSGTMFRFSGQELRQDPQSHHLILNRYFGRSDVHDPSFGTWTCNGGDRDGQQCEPTDLTSCGTGFCMTPIQQSFACIGFGPSDGSVVSSAIGGAQKAQASVEYVDGVFAQIPMKGILYWNSHAFNLTDEDTTMHARLNYYFAKSQQYPLQPIFNISAIFAPDAAPYTTQTVCNNQDLPQGARLFELSSHTHKHGKGFTVTAPDGTLLYQSFVYNDPVDLIFDPPLAFDSADPAQRRLRYCSLYNNGVAADGSPDPTTVTRASHVPPQGFQCNPTACVSGKIGASCFGTGDDRRCDSSAGARDGSCDACPITGGESTENEMFILIGSYHQNGPGSGVSAGVAQGLGAAPNAGERSMVTEPILPAPVACSSSHAGHAAMH
jgi:hypothetical protein